MIGRVIGVWAAPVPLAIFAVSTSMSPAEAQVPNGGNGTIYWAGYDHAIHVIDESTMQVTEKIATQAGIPTGLTFSTDKKRFYVREASGEKIEIVDLEARRSIGSFTLSEGDTKVRINGFAPSPDDSYAILFTRAYTKLRDRYEIGESLILKYDLEAGQVTDTIAPPDGQERNNARIMFSPDGSSVYFFAGQDILVLETEGFTEVDRWELSEDFQPGLGRLGLSFPEGPHQDPGFFTGLFRVTDPVNNRRMMGVATVNLAERDVDFYTLGPSEGVSFQLAPGGKKAYGLLSSIGRYEFWTFDLEGRRVEGSQPFEGRPRMALVPSSNGRFLYIYNAGNTIDIYDAATYEHVHQVEFDADMTDFVLVPGSDG